MDFSLTTLFVIPAGNTLPVADSTDALTANQFGVFNEAYVARTAANIATSQYIYFAQGRAQYLPGVGTKRSDKIYAANKITWYKVPGTCTSVGQITEVDEFHGKCGEDLTITLRLFSNWIETAYFNGLTRSFTIQAPCCDCGSDPCTDVDAEALVDLYVAAINADPLISKYIVASKTGVGAAAVLVLTGQVLDKYGNPCSPTAFSFEYDLLRFDTFAYRAAATTQDFLTADACDIFATVTKTQTATYPVGTGDEIYQLEKRYFSYQTTMKSIFRNVEYDGQFARESDPAVCYTMYYLKYKDADDQTWELSEKLSEAVVLAVPPALVAGLDALLTPFLGAPKTITLV